MSYDIETVGFCPQYYSLWRVPSSKGDDSYQVTLNGFGGQAPHCTCKAFQYSGGYGAQDCKHVRLVWEHGCLYNPQWKDAGPNDYADLGISLVDTDAHNVLESQPCQGCGQPTIAVKIAV